MSRNFEWCTMAKTARELIEDEEKEGTLLETDVQIEILREAAKNPESSPSEIARKTTHSPNYVGDVLRKATAEHLERHAADILDTDEETAAKHVTNIYIFSDMDEEEIRRILRLNPSE